MAGLEYQSIRWEALRERQQKKRVLETMKVRWGHPPTCKPAGGHPHSDVNSDRVRGGGGVLALVICGWGTNFDESAEFGVWQ